MGWVSTVEYYRIINQEVAARLGKSHSARMVIHSFERDEIYGPLYRGDADAVMKKFVYAARNLKKSGADFLLLCANTAHFFCGRSF